MKIMACAQICTAVCLRFYLPNFPWEFPYFFIAKLYSLPYFPVKIVGHNKTTDRLVVRKVFEMHATGEKLAAIGKPFHFTPQLANYI